MKLKNKIFLSLGTAASVVAPIATTVACGETQTVTQTAIQQRELWAKAQPLIETKYQEMLISNVSKTHDEFESNIEETNLQTWTKLAANYPKVMNFVKQFFLTNIYTTPTYLQTFATKLLHMKDTVSTSPSTPDQLFQFADLVKDGFYKSFEANTDITKVDATPGSNYDVVSKLFDKYIGVLWDMNVANIKNSVYQYIIASYYLDTTKTDYMNVFVTPVGSTKKITGTEGLLVPNKYFVLGQKTLAAKYAFDWKITLDAQSSKAYAGVSMDSETLDKELKASTSGSANMIYGQETRSQKRAVLPTFFQDTKTSTIWGDLINDSKEITGYAGLVDKSTYASSDSQLRQVTDGVSYDKNYEGYIDDKTQIVDQYPERHTPIDGDKFDNNSKTYEYKNVSGVVGWYDGTTLETVPKVLYESTTYATEKKLTSTRPSTSVSPEIKLTLPAATDAAVTIEKVVMLLPQYVSGQLTLDYLNDSTNNYTVLKRTMLSQQLTAIYNEAVQYYSSRDNQEFNWDATKKIGGIRLDILDDSLRKIAVDSFGLTYVKKDDER